MVAVSRAVSATLAPCGVGGGGCTVDMRGDVGCVVTIGVGDDEAFGDVERGGAAKASRATCVASRASCVMRAKPSISVQEASRATYEVIVGLASFLMTTRDGGTAVRRSLVDS